MVGIDDGDVALRNARIQVHQATASATDSQEIVRQSPVLEVRTNRDRLTVIDLAQTTVCRY